MKCIMVGTQQPQMTRREKDGKYDDGNDGEDADKDGDGGDGEGV